jgi:hypothetical protein
MTYANPCLVWDQATEMGGLVEYPKTVSEILDAPVYIYRTPGRGDESPFVEFGEPMVEGIDADARKPAALVLAPTRELACQIVDDLEPICRARSVRIASIGRCWSTAGRPARSSQSTSPSENTSERPSRDLPLARA